MLNKCGCGGEANRGLNPLGFYVRCTQCGIEVQEIKSHAEAERIWNTAMSGAAPANPGPGVADPAAVCGGGNTYARREFWKRMFFELDEDHTLTARAEYADRALVEYDARWEGK